MKKIIRLNIDDGIPENAVFLSSFPVTAHYTDYQGHGYEEITIYILFLIEQDEPKKA